MSSESYGFVASGSRDLVDASTCVVDGGELLLHLQGSHQTLNSLPNKFDHITSPLKPTDSNLRNHRKQAKRQLQSTKMGGRAGSQCITTSSNSPQRKSQTDRSIACHSSRSTRSQVDSFETKDYTVLTGNTSRSHTRVGYQPTEVRKSSKASAKASEHGRSAMPKSEYPGVASRSFEANKSCRDHTMNEPTSPSPPDAENPSRTTQVSDAVKPHLVSLDEDGKSSLSSRSQITSPHKLETMHTQQNVTNGSSARLQQTNPSNAAAISPITPIKQTTRVNNYSHSAAPSHSNGAFTPSSCESASGKVITHDERKASFWSRATGSVPGSQEPLRPSWVDSQPSVAEDPQWYDGEAEEATTNGKRASHRISLRNMPTYKFPASRKKVLNITEDSFERQQSYVSPSNRSPGKITTLLENSVSPTRLQEQHSNEEGEVLENNIPGRESSGLTDLSTPTIKGQAQNCFF